MKKLLLYATIVALTACSHENCEEKKKDIFAKYEEQLKLYPNDENRRNLIKERRDWELANAC